MQRLLLVDGERDALGRLESLFREHADEFEIEALTSPQAALERTRHTFFDLAITAFAIPEMDGVAFAKGLWQSQPDAACIIMSGLPDREALIRRVKGVLRNHPQNGKRTEQVPAGTSHRRNILRFINTPWDDLALIILVAQALAFRAALQENHRLVATHGVPPNSELRAKHFQVLVVGEQKAFSSLARGLNHQSPFHDLHGAMRHRSALESRRDAHEYRFIVEAADSPHRALELAKRIPFDVVISDHAISEVSSSDFLEELRESQPHTPRLLLSDSADRNTLLDAFNNLGIFGYIGKHWGLHDMKHAVAQAIAYRNLLLENRDLAKRAIVPPAAMAVEAGSA